MDYECVEGSSKKGKALGLVLYIKRRSTLTTLAIALGWKAQQPKYQINIYEQGNK